MFGKMGERSVVALDWDAARLRVVHAGVKRGAVRIVHLLSATIPESIDVSDPSAMGGVIRQVLSQQKIRATRALVSVPRDQALLTTLKLPLAGPQEMPNVVEFQITKELPFPIGQAVVDFAAEDGAEGEIVDVMVGTVRREVVSYYEQTLQAAGLEAERLGLRPNANLVSLEALAGGGDEQRTVFVDVGPRLTEIDVVYRGAVAFSRAASVTLYEGPADGDAQADDSDSDDQGSAIIQFPKPAAADATSREDQSVRSLLMEVARTIEAYRAGDPQMRFDRIVVGGSVGLEARLAEALHDRFGTDVTLYNPAAQFGWPAQRGEKARGFASVLGLVTGSAEPDRLHFDFLHPKKALSKTERRLKRAPYAAIAAVLVIAAGVGFYFTMIAPKEAKLAKLKKKLRTTTKSIETLKEFEDKTLSFVDGFEQDQVIWLDELDRILAVLPDTRDMLLKRIDMNQKGPKISLPLECKMEVQISQFVDRLSAIRLPGMDEQYYEARQGATKRTGGQYKVSGRVDITIVGDRRP